MVNKRLFGTFGVRRLANKVLTPEFASKLAAAYGTLVKGSVAVGGDPRTSTPMIKHAVISGLLSSGCKVIDLGILPTPAVQYAVRNYYDGGVIITASHNPPHDNGIKFVDADGIGIPDEMEEKIEDMFFAENPERVSWDHIEEVETNSNIIDEYIEQVISLVDGEAIKDAGLKVVVDCGSGAACFTTPYLLRGLGCQVITMNCQPDGFFPGRKPEPSEANLKELMKVVEVTGADMGIAHDGDADRMIAVDDKGRMADFDKLLALVSAEIGGCVVTTVDASACIDRALEGVGGTVERTKVGDVHVAEMIHNIEATFGGEPSGTWLHPEFCMCPDGILSALKVIKLVQNRGPLSLLLDNVPVYPTMRAKIDCREDQKDPIMEKAKNDLPSIYQEVMDVNLKDGVRISFEDGSWVLVRPSGTESFIRITLEGKTEDKARMIHEKAAKFIHELL